MQVTDANGCTKTDIKIDLTQPDRDDWTLKGNIINGLDSVFIGTVDSSEFSIRTFNQSRINVMPNGDVEIAENLVVKALYSESTIGFGNQNFLASRAQDSIFPEIISYGRLPSVLPLSLPYCNAPILNANPINQFNGHLQLYGNSSVGGSLGVMDIGFDGVNAFIESTGSSPDPNSNRLLLNYYCGKDVFVGNSTSGDFTANRDLFVNGRIGIGTRNITNCADCSSYSLFVKGGIRAERIKLDIASNNGWADYVFDKQYHLMEIHELKEYIKHNKHLPGVPSQEEVKVNGIDVAEMNKILLSKIEELTLYIIELNSDLESIKKRK